MNEGELKSAWAYYIQNSYTIFVPCSACLDISDDSPIGWNRIQFVELKFMQGNVRIWYKFWISNQSQESRKGQISIPITRYHKIQGGETKLMRGLSYRNGTLKRE